MKPKIYNIAVLVTLIILTHVVSHAQQEPLYTQYMFNTQTINPAYAGTWESGGFVTLARHQWVGWEGAPKTYTFSFQAPLKNENFALGLNVISDRIGREKRFSLLADYSFLIKLTETSKLRLGLKGGFTNYSNNLTLYNLDEEGNQDPLFSTYIDNKFMPSFGFGAFLYDKNYYLGVSIPRLVSAKFEENYNNYSTQYQMRHYYLIAGLVFTLNEYLKFKPTFLAKATSGVPSQFDFTANFLFNEKIWLGAMIRTGDSFGFIAQWIVKERLRLGYAIDFTTTKLQNHHNGTHEIMISYELKFSKEEVVSPRYF